MIKTILCKKRMTDNSNGYQVLMEGKEEEIFEWRSIQINLKVEMNGFWKSSKIPSGFLIIFAEISAKNPGQNKTK
jgi:hypothetical protein